MKLLGHRNINNTLIYTHLVNFDRTDSFTCRVAKTIKDARLLIETGFDYVCDMGSIKLFRKPK
jgi:hypothetical protein